MKSSNYIARLIRRWVFSLFTVAIVAAVGGVAHAQYKPTGDDGITASPRLRQQLDERRARTSARAVEVPKMACSKCQDTMVSVRNTESKGVGARTLMGNTTKLVAQHSCAGCGVDWAVVGTGKAKQSVATHKCSGCGSEILACCSAKGSGAVATKGMEQKIQVAPVK